MSGRPAHPGGEYVDATAWVTLLLAFITLGAVLVALFQERIRARLNRTELQVEVRTEPPYCLKIPLHRQVPCEVVDETTGQPTSGIRVFAFGNYHCRIAVRNTGKTSATDVEVFVAELREQQADGAFVRSPSFIPMNLKWANVLEPFMPRILPDMYRFCDVAHVVSPSDRRHLPYEHRTWPEVDESKCILSLVTEVTPTSLSHLLRPGRYELDLRVAAANAGPIERTLHIGLSGEWYEDDREMLGRGITLSLQRPYRAPHVREP